MSWNEVVATLTEATVEIQTLRAENAELGKQRDEAVELLKDLEWVADGCGEQSLNYCPCCAESEPPRGGHASDCELAVFIARFKGEQE